MHLNDRNQADPANQLQNMEECDFLVGLAPVGSPKQVEGEPLLSAAIAILATAARVMIRPCLSCCSTSNALSRCRRWLGGAVGPASFQAIRGQHAL